MLAIWCKFEQTNPRAPDFKHKSPEKTSWIHRCYNSGRVRKEIGSQRMLSTRASSGQAGSSSEDNEELVECGCSYKAGLRSGAQMNASEEQEMSENNSWEILNLEEALASLERMPQLPSYEDFICILKSCRKTKNLAYAKRLHAYMFKCGLETHRSLGNYLVPMLVECGSMCDAQQVFNRLVDRNEFSWTSLITDYIERGESRHALNLYQEMQDDCVQPSKYTFLALLKVCVSLNDVNRGRQIHADIAGKGLERDPCVGNTLVDLYAKCGLLVKAQEVFDRLAVRDVVSWTALIAGYAEHGLGEEALICFKQMQLEGISPDAVAYVCSLKACGSIGAIDKVQEIHAEIDKKGLERDPFVGNTLVNMYAKCGLLTTAREVFDKILVRNVVSWNALIAGYIEHGLGEEVLNCYQQMQCEVVSPDAVTFICSLRACGSMGSTDKGREIHSEIATKGLERDPFVATTLVDMYAKCGSLAKAREVFDTLPIRNVASWNAIIAGYAEHELGEEALSCYEQMQVEGFSPDAATFVCSLQACGSTEAVEKGKEIHAEIVRKGLERDPFVGSTLVDMYAKCGLLAKAQDVFDRIPVRDVVLWTALIAGYAEHGRAEEVLFCFEQMQLEGVSPDAVTFNCSLKACGSIGAIDKGQDIHSEIAHKGFVRDPFIGNTLVDMYARCGLLAKALELFDNLPVRDVVSWNAIIAGYAEHGLGDEAINCFERMQMEGVPPDALTFVASLKACGSIGGMDKGQEIHVEIARKGLEGDLCVGSTLVDMYAKGGCLAKAQEVFDRLALRDVVLWNTLIAGYAQLGESEVVFHMFERMRGEGINPSGLTFLSILTACSHTGLVDMGQKYFEVMSKDYGITPTIEHHTCMVDILGRAGQVDQAIAMVGKMPFHPNLVVWHTILAACRKLGNVEAGRQAFEHAVQLNEKDDAMYVLMSTIYASAHMQDEEKKVHSMWERFMEETRTEMVDAQVNLAHIPKAKTYINMQSHKIFS